MYLNQKVNAPENTYGEEPNAIDPVALNADLEIFPNPFQNDFQIALPFGAKPAEMQVYDFTGREVLHRRIQGDAVVQVEGSSLPAGVYFVRVVQQGKRFSAKLVKP